NRELMVGLMDVVDGDDDDRIMYMWIESDSYIEEDGEFRYTDEIENAEHREDKMGEYVPWVGINPPGLVKEDYFSGSEATEASIESADKIEPFVPEEIWSKFTYTKDETSFMNSTGNDIEKYVEEMRDKFISGDESLDDSNWDSYIEAIENMGLEEYMSTQQSAYERYSDH